MDSPPAENEPGASGPAHWPRPWRLLLDTNFALAGLLWSGPPRRLLQWALQGHVLLFSSRALLAELERTLGYEHLAKRLAFVQSSPSALVQQYAALVTLADPVSVPRVVADDPDDDAVVAAALAAKVDCIVSGDKHLLRLNGKIAVPVLRAAGVVATSAI